VENYQKETFYADAVARIEALPGVESVGAVFGLPLSGFKYSISLHDLDGRRLDPEDPAQPSTQVRVVTPDALRMTLKKGRVFTDADGKDAPAVAIVNESAAKQLWPNEDPIGRRFTLGTRLGLGGERAGGEVVGVVADIKHYGLSLEPRPEVYLPHRGESIARPRLYTLLLTLFAAAALLLAALGVYGILAFNVAERTREMGVRMALGAAGRDVVGLVVREGLLVALVGLTLGFGGSFASGRLLRQLLFGVSPTDLVTFASVGLLLIAVALAACYLPARRAARVDPMVALRTD
jgi:putative ABC transport system permease protein